MLSLYEILKASKTGIAPDMWTALAGMNWSGADSGHEVKELTGIPPLSFTADGTPLLDYLISGNMSQTGTPTPDSPVMPQETGERTGNLWNKLGFSANAINSSGVHTTTNSYGTTLSASTGSSVEITQIASGGNTNYQNGFFFIEIDFSQFSIGDAFVISFDYEITNKLSTVNTTVSYIGQGTSVTNVIADWSNSGRAVIKATFDSSMTKPYVEIRLCGNSINVTNVQIIRGSTALPYEPYGYFIEIEVS